MNVTFRSKKKKYNFWKMIVIGIFRLSECIGQTKMNMIFTKKYTFPANFLHLIVWFISFWLWEVRLFYSTGIFCGEHAGIYFPKNPHVLLKRHFISKLQTLEHFLYDVEYLLYIRWPTLFSPSSVPTLKKNCDEM